MALTLESKEVYHVYAHNYINACMYSLPLVMVIINTVFICHMHQLNMYTCTQQKIS